MEFLDEDARPRFLFQSKAVTSSAIEAEPHYKNLSKPFIAFTVSVSFLLLGLSFFFLKSEPYQIAPHLGCSLHPRNSNGVRDFEEEKDWVKEDVEVLKKQLLKNPVGDENNVESTDRGFSWAATEDIALLNALKAFSKEVSMRWEKIAAA
ncbi:hypothetical protein M0R45_006262 [Rubus argutus]|uniref:Uncharacterized protein n=1 Tax=Rubus argutus TaxID=59490 RepID=A0AAW1YQ13_RUBAR